MEHCCLDLSRLREQLRTRSEVFGGNMACVSKAVIIGGGFAGLAAGISLAKAGVQCDILELAASGPGH